MLRWGLQQARLLSREDGKHATSYGKSLPVRS